MTGYSTCVERVIYCFVMYFDVHRDPIECGFATLACEVGIRSTSWGPGFSRFCRWDAHVSVDFGVLLIGKHNYCDGGCEPGVYGCVTGAVDSVLLCPWNCLHMTLGLECLMDTVFFLVQFVVVNVVVYRFTQGVECK